MATDTATIHPLADRLDEPFRLDYRDFRADFDAWVSFHGFSRSSWDFGDPNFLADEVLGKFSIGRPVELSAVVMPDFGARPRRDLRFVGVTFGSGAGTDRPDAPIVDSFGALEVALGLRVDTEAMVDSPGKFEGEREVLREAYDTYLNGFADDDGEVLTVEVPVAWRRMPDTGPYEFETIRFFEDDLGFLYEVDERDEPLEANGT